ncbi:uncharacterized protein SCHCODRAFT_02212367 [Schizophyllum commune H4-8]|uniref:uncharacterized protein n=1 Tax=Schizophyllum commune (strain H4-8 / FGSC 9210) TaxID=578458 RepID=UPI00215E4CBE|nr:uncharacterized protein SCHCODRAFT_02212367 [Schizophyllum commune H4-8]KAI5894593.1 hypothetical protein SCHCODRAFT_02212367 [Schizophyllum commune H4-8]
MESKQCASMESKRWPTDRGHRRRASDSRSRSRRSTRAECKRSRRTKQTSSGGEGDGKSLRRKTISPRTTTRGGRRRHKRREKKRRTMVEAETGWRSDTHPVRRRYTSGAANRIRGRYCVRGGRWLRELCRWLWSANLVVGSGLRILSMAPIRGWSRRFRSTDAVATVPQSPACYRTPKPGLLPYSKAGLATVPSSRTTDSNTDIERKVA